MMTNVKARAISIELTIFLTALSLPACDEGVEDGSEEQTPAVGSGGKADDYEEWGEGGEGDEVAVTGQEFAHCAGQVSYWLVACGNLAFNAIWAYGAQDAVGFADAIKDLGESQECISATASVAKCIRGASKASSPGPFLLPVQQCMLKTNMDAELCGSCCEYSPRTCADGCPIYG